MGGWGKARETGTKERRKSKGGGGSSAGEEPSEDGGVAERGAGDGDGGVD
ncbi:UNVERIFIED_CONTAM: hypothetical protein Sradi_0174400 [Sesamum radiatum]|uniref:Uncharacterized protein n=1 Tax=Sesamum radiatum TaxID=300843 RepID=A0AAW2VYN6_SESRA